MLITIIRAGRTRVRIFIMYRNGLVIFPQCVFLRYVWFYWMYRISFQQIWTNNSTGYGRRSVFGYCLFVHMVVISDIFYKIGGQIQWITFHVSICRQLNIPLQYAFGNLFFKSNHRMNKRNDHDWNTLINKQKQISWAFEMLETDVRNIPNNTSYLNHRVNKITLT